MVRLPLDHVILRRDVPPSWCASWLPFLIDSISTLMGIGGGSLSVPTITLCNPPVHRSVGASSLLGLWIAAPALGFLIADVAHLPTPPFNLGYLNYLGFALIAPVTWFAAQFGAHLAPSPQQTAAQPRIRCISDAGRAAHDLVQSGLMRHCRSNIDAI